MTLKIFGRQTKVWARSWHTYTIDWINTKSVAAIPKDNKDHKRNRGAVNRSRKFSLFFNLSLFFDRKIPFFLTVLQSIYTSNFRSSQFFLYLKNHFLLLIPGSRTRTHHTTIKDSSTFTVYEWVDITRRSALAHLSAVNYLPAKHHTE